MNDLHTDFSAGQGAPDTQFLFARGEPLSLDGQAQLDTQNGSAVEGTHSPTGQEVREAQVVVAGREHTPSAEAIVQPPPEPDAPLLTDPLLIILADALDDLERTRIANENRLRQLTRTEPDEDGEVRGFGLDVRHPAVARLSGIVDGLAGMEHEATLALQRQMRAHPLGPWQKRQKGVGEKQLARLLAVIGDPYWNGLHERPRTVSELWAYCGLHTLPSDQLPVDTHTRRVSGAPSPLGQNRRDTHDPYAEGTNVAARRRKGTKANWSTLGKARAWLIASKCVMFADSPYRAVYLDRREHTTATHPEWSKGHSHNDALRIASKALLADLWREARRLHGAQHDAAAA